MNNEKTGSPPCGLYVRVDVRERALDDVVSMTKTIREIALVINRTSGYERNKHVVEFAFNAADRTQSAAVSALVEVVQAQGLIAILAGTHADVLGADGVLVENAEDFHEARKALSNEAIIGVSCGTSKDRAQEALLLEADYVVLDGDVPLVQWWYGQKAAVRDILCCVSGDVSLKNVGDIAAAGADFVDMSNYILNHDDGAMQAAVNVLHALEVAVQAPGKMN